MADGPGFIHLRVHSEHSLLEGAVRLKDLPGMCVEAGMPAVAVTDTNNMFAALEFSVLASGAGIQPIIGCQTDLLYGREAGGGPSPAPVVLLAKNGTGYRNLLKLNSCLYLRTDGHVPEPHVTLDDLCGLSEGLILLTGGPDGPLGRLVRAGKDAEACALLDRLAEAFGTSCYMEIQRHPDPKGMLTDEETATERWMVETAYDRDIPLAATNDVYFPGRGMHAAHDALLCVSGGVYVDQNEPRRRVTPAHFFRTAEEMAHLFRDIPEAAENTVEIARRCAYMAEKRDPILPVFADDEVDELRRQAREGLDARLASIVLSAPEEEYRSRLEFEIDMIVRMGFPGYFLIVADFIKWAKGRDIPVGPGRGSGAGSLVAYALTITDLDPLRYGLLFERFLNPDRVSMPDFDIDFCMNRRDEVIGYVRERYGGDRVAQIVTFGAMLSKAAVRDVGRVLQVPYGQVDRLARLVPFEGARPMALSDAVKSVEAIKEEKRKDRRIALLLEYGMELEGLLRNASTHAAGVVIADRPLDSLVPLYRDPRSAVPAVQFSMKWAEAAGLVKFDFLGLKTLTAIREALDLLRESGTEIDISAIPMDDPKTFRLYASARTAAVFQVESPGMMDALRRMKPTCIDDIVALVALYRPGPMDSIPKYCDVKNGKSERDRIHESIDHILDETQGIIVYQEQVMRIAREMAGYTLAGADLLRRAMGKKIRAEMDAERPKFLAGAKRNGVGADTAEEVWTLLEKFADYGFNKSHAVAYAVVSYQTAWLKANHPAEYMAGVMTCDLNVPERLACHADEVRYGLGIGIDPPCVNRSGAGFRVEGGRLVYALGALRNVGPDAMRDIVRARGGRAFSSLEDFARRVDLRRTGRRPLQTLALAGAFDCIEANRRRVHDGAEALVSWSASLHGQMESGQDSLFGAGGDDISPPVIPDVEDWEFRARLAGERDVIGFHLSGHPLDGKMALLKRHGVIMLEDMADRASRAPVVARVAGTVLSVDRKVSSNGEDFAFLEISDPGAAMMASVFPDVLKRIGTLPEEGSDWVMTVAACLEDRQVRARVESVAPVGEVLAEAGPAGLRICLDGAVAVPGVASFLAGLEDGDSGGQAVPGGRVMLRLLSRDLPWAVDIDAGGEFAGLHRARGGLSRLKGVVSVEDI